jgi:hypothetical protein
MVTNAERRAIQGKPDPRTHAETLVRVYGKDQARNIATANEETAQRSDRKYWRDVLSAIEAAS